jgi:sec-independent protein translocase protein TatC
MSSLPKALGTGSVKAVAKLGGVIRHPLAPVRSLRDIWNAPDGLPETFEEMTLAEHLEELRSRIVKACLAILPAFAIGLFFSKRVIRLIQHQAKIENGFLILSPTEPFTTFMKVALYIALTIAFPLILYQVIAFVAPGLTRKEKRYLLTSLPFVTGLFIAGASFAFFIAAPRAFDFLSNFGNGLFRWDPRGPEVLSFYLTLMIGMGVAFELPVVMYMLAKLRIANARRQASIWRYAVVGLMIAAALITPTPDPFNMMVVATPLLGLYGFGLLLARAA